jgi:hypothetical protein
VTPSFVAHIGLVPVPQVPVVAPHQGIIIIIIIGVGVGGVLGLGLKRGCECECGRLLAKKEFWKKKKFIPSTGFIYLLPYCTTTTTTIY